MNIESFVYVLSAFLGWLTAQAIKFVLSLRQDGLHFDDAFASGGMPSSHSSFMASITMVIGLIDGFDSGLFGLSFAILGIVVYDSIGVRRATGDNTLVIKKMMKQLKLKERENALHLAKGHKPVEVAVGLVVGALTGLILHSLVF